MKRLDESLKMSRLLKNNEIDEGKMRELARIVAGFHQKAEKTPKYNSPELISSQIADLGNFRETIDKASGFGEWIDRLLKRSSQFIKSNRKLIEKRQVDFVRDCHGDLHGENIFFQDGIKIIDCIEFSEEFRCIDVASDIAFMAMDLEYAGREDLSDVFVSEYLERTGDPELETLLPFYKCYRANVRAKIAAIEWMQNKSHEARERIDRYVLLAERYSKSL
jgi:aminoglycoside phosphotransferase family enzyme